MAYDNNCQYFAVIPSLFERCVVRKTHLLIAQTAVQSGGWQRVPEQAGSLAAKRRFGVRLPDDPSQGDFHPWIYQIPALWWCKRAMYVKAFTFEVVFISVPWLDGCRVK